jgi:hypothetical protein
MYTKTHRQLKVRTVKNRIIHPKKTKGVKYTVEPLKVKTRDPSIQGDIFKKYVNGVLVKQVFVSKNKLKELINKIKNKFSKGGAKTTRKNKQQVQPQPVVVLAPQGQVAPQQIEVSDKTTFGQNVKSGVGSGFGLGLGFAAAEGLMDAVFGDN